MALHGANGRGIVGIEAGGSLQKSPLRDQAAAAGKERIQCGNALSMSSSALFRNAVSKRSGGDAAQSNVEERKPGGASAAPVCLFDGLFGGNRNRKAPRTVPSEPQFKYHDDVPLPFPTSLLSNTFLSGLLSLLCLCSSI